jgi:hypothetical protein
MIGMFVLCGIISTKMKDVAAMIVLKSKADIGTNCECFRPRSLHVIKTYMIWICGVERCLELYLNITETD